MKRRPDTPTSNVNGNVDCWKLGEVDREQPYRGRICGESCPEVDGAAYMPGVYKIPKARNRSWCGLVKVVAMKNHIALQAQSSQQAHSKSLKVYAKIGYGSAGTTVNNCTNRGTVTGQYNNSSAAYGDIVGYAFANGSVTNTVSNCTNYGDVKSTALSYGKVGGIVGAANSTSSKLTITNCKNGGTLTAP